jgi:hypothetical protein
MVCRRALSTTASQVVKATVGKALRETGAAMKYAAGEEVSVVKELLAAGARRSIFFYIFYTTKFCIIVLDAVSSSMNDEAILFLSLNNMYI